MRLEDRLKNKLESLITEARALSQGNELGQIRTEEQSQQCRAWIVDAANTVTLIASDPDSTYRQHFAEATSHYGDSQFL